MTYIWISFLIIGLIYGYFYRKKFYDLNRQLFTYLEISSFSLRHNTIEAAFTMTGAWSWQFFRLYSDGKSLILIDPFHLDLNRNSKLYAGTYLIATEEQLANYPSDIFKNILTIKTIESNKEILVITGKMKYQLMFKTLTWIRQSNNFKLKIKKPSEKFDFEEIIEYKK